MGLRSCRWANGERDRTCAQCGLDRPLSVNEQVSRALPGVNVVRDVQDGTVAAAFSDRPGAAGQPHLEPFFHLDAEPHHSRPRRLLRLWPLVVFVVVLLFFAIAGLAR